MQIRIQKLIPALAFATLAAVAACRQSAPSNSDSGLQNDLSLANQQNHALDSVTAAEMADSMVRVRDSVHAAQVAEARPVHHAVHHASSSTTTSSNGDVVTTTTSSTGEVTVKHTKRDAEIGAAAGAVLGVVGSKNKVKGGVIGGVLGGVLGGVIGNNVDKQKKPPQF